MASYRKLKSGWKVTISTRDENGKLRQTSKQGFATKKDAQAYAYKHDYKAAKAGSVAFSAYYWNWFNTYKAAKVRPNTASVYNNAGLLLERYFKNRPMKNITRTDYQKFLNELGKNHTRTVVTLYTSAYKACVKSALADEVISKNFTLQTEKTWKDKEEVEYLELDELKRLIEYVESKLDGRYLSYYVIYVAIYTGMRLGEILALEWSDIDFDAKTISITKTYNSRAHQIGPTKTPSSVRTIKVNNKILAALLQLKQRNTKKYVFSTAGKIISSPPVNSGLHRALKAIGINKNFHFHCLRHSHVAYLLANDVDLYAISKRLGHKDMTITAKTYAYLLEDKREKEENKIVDILNDL